jgi:hypothetical protein
MKQKILLLTFGMTMYFTLQSYRIYFLFFNCYLKFDLMKMGNKIIKLKRSLKIKKGVVSLRQVA